MNAKHGATDAVLENAGVHVRGRYDREIVPAEEPPMTPELLQQVGRAVEALRSLEDGPREQYLEQLRRRDPALAAAVQDALARQETSHLTAAAGTGDDGAATAPPSDRPPPAVEETPTHLGPYEVHGQVGKGGMGVVWRVRDRLFRRSLALKALAEHHKDNLDLRRRFLEEAQLMGQLQHPGIPPVHDLGELPDGRPFFAMKLIRGKTLAALLKERAGPGQEWPRLLAIFEQVCQTLAYAHAQGIIHRDLKPANVMVGAFAEVQVMDWGLAKLIGAPEEAAGQASTICMVRTEAPDTATRTGQALGTPAYMAPEQARGEVGLLDERADVFGLGAILCEILTGQPPFTGRDSREVMRSAQRGDNAAALARLAQGGADGELVALARGCLAAEKEARPADAGAVAQALTTHLARVQERLRQAELERRAAEVRTAEERKRRRVALRLGAVIGLLVLALGAAGWWMDRSAAAARQEREEQLLRGRQAAETLFEQADQALAARQPERAAAALQLARQRLADLEAADLAQRLVETERDLALLRELERLFYRRWQVAQQVVLEQLESGRVGSVLAGEPSGRAAVGVAPALGKAQLRQEYAGTLARYGFGLDRPAGANLVQRVRQSRLQAALRDAFDQWFLLEPDSAALLAALNALDAPRARARQGIVHRAAGKPLPDDLVLDPGADHEPTTALYLSELLPDDQATALLRQTVRRHADDPRLLTVLTYRLMMSQPSRAAEAVGFARAAHGLQPHNGSACLLVAMALSEDHRHDEAAAYSERALELDPHSAAACIHLGFLANEKGDHDRAIVYLKNAVALDPHHAVAFSNLGFSYIRKRDYEQAIAYLQQGIALDGKRAVAHCNLGFIYNELGEYDRAIAALEKAAELNPRESITYYNLAFAYSQKKEYDRALVYLKQAIALDDRNAVAHSQLGFVLNELGEYDQAITQLQRAIALEPERAVSHANLGYSYVRKRDYNQALLALKRAVVLDSKLVFAHGNLGFLNNERGEYDQAIVHLQQAIDLDPKDAASHGNLGFSYLRKHDYGQAVAALKKATALDPKFVSALTNLGFVYNEQGEFDRAVAVLEKAVALSPNEPMARNNLGFACLGKGDFDRAIVQLLKVVELTPNDTNAHANLGHAYTSRGQLDRALVHYLTATRLAPKSAVIQEKAAVVLGEAGRLAEARDALRRAVELTPADAPPLAARKKQLEALEALVLLEGRLEDVVAGKLEPKDFLQAMQQGKLCRLKQYYAAAVLLYAKGLAFDAAAAKRLAPADLLMLARVNVLAAAGAGQDPPPTAERPRYRAAALPWLRQFVAVWRQALDRDPQRSRYAVQQNLRTLLQHDDLASVRPPALDGLAADERQPWQAFWKEVQTLLERADARPAE
jgi:tetratricopeptide (TPR) repeat protein